MNKVIGLLVMLSALASQSYAGDNELVALRNHLLSTLPYQCDTLSVEFKGSYLSEFDPRSKILPVRLRNEEVALFLHLKPNLVTSDRAYFHFTPIESKPDAECTTVFLASGDSVVLLSSGRPMSPSIDEVWRQESVLAQFWDSLFQVQTLEREYTNHGNMGLARVTLGPLLSLLCLNELENENEHSDLERAGLQAGVLLFAVSAATGVYSLAKYFRLRSKSKALERKLWNWEEAHTRDLMSHVKPTAK